MTTETNVNNVTNINRALTSADLFRGKQAAKEEIDGVGVVYIGQLTAADVIALTDAQGEGKTAIDRNLAFAGVLKRRVLDAEGAPILAEVDAMKIATELPLFVFNALAAAVNKHSGLNVEKATDGDGETASTPAQPEGKIEAGKG